MKLIHDVKYLLAEDWKKCGIGICDSKFPLSLLRPLKELVTNAPNAYLYKIDDLRH